MSCSKKVVKKKLRPSSKSQGSLHQLYTVLDIKGGLALKKKMFLYKKNDGHWRKVTTTTAKKREKKRVRSTASPY